MKPLEEWFEQSEALRLLVRKLETNLDALVDELNEDEKEILMRCNLIVIRQCLQDYGVE